MNVNHVAMTCCQQGEGVMMSLAGGLILSFQPMRELEIKEWSMRCAAVRQKSIFGRIRFFQSNSSGLSL